MQTNEIFYKQLVFNATLAIVMPALFCLPTSIVIYEQFDEVKHPCKFQYSWKEIKILNDWIQTVDL